MATPYVSPSVALNITLQQEKMNRQIWKIQLYNRLVGFANMTPQESGAKYVTPIGLGDKGNSLIPMSEAKGVDAPINVFTDFSERGTDMQLPRKRKKFGKPSFGDDTLQGRGESFKWVYDYLRVNKIKDAIATKAGDMSEQAYKKFLPDLVGQARPELTDKFAMYINTAMIKDSIFYGKSYELRLATTAYGRALTAISNPNMYVPGSALGWVSYNIGSDTYNNLPGSAGYETDVETALNSLTDTASKHFTPELVDKMRFLLPQKRIMPTVTIGGNRYYLWIITSRQAKQLTASTAWKQMAREILPREKDNYNNWLFNGALGIYNGFIFLEDMDGWGAHTNANPGGYVTAPTAGVPVYGPEDTVNSAGEWNKIKGIDTSNFQMSVILGSQAVNFGMAKKIWFTDEIWDHNQKSEVGAHFIAGAERVDDFDTDNQLGGGAGAFVEHTGSAVVGTYSPSVL